ncbi:MULTISPECIES: cell wall metabolism sensor histidine kinase WalK [unclassified Oleiphilus]|nr:MULTISPECIES: ATP-binding protein [unclassified Oleiphilus]KZY36389.1 hypothetical protein A3729_03905 [Oleiphilus sp. HI0043]KZY61944.1 hypothetical protein A3735_10460 [Oleiphilus sp. HI0061]KZZ34450.1 hypothetical protein A3756_00295 [Oleiphilus sp. HI0086]KZZ68139.1 hypothetical protein A3763_14920 [Oleiphilus sp. HI0128]
MESKNIEKGAMRRKLPFYTKLAVTISIIGIFVTGMFFVLALWSSDKYHQEVTQRLHRDLAPYILDHLSEPLFLDKAERENGSLNINKKALKGIAINTMMINPSVEVYLLDNNGQVLGHALPDASIDKGQVNVRAIDSWLKGEGNEAVLGSNPREPDKLNIFSAAPVFFQGKQKGFLYIVLASHESASIAESLQSSHIIRIVLGAMCAISLFFVFSALLSFKRITSPLRKLAQEIRTYREAELGTSDAWELRSNSDEIEVLSSSFSLMRQRIQSQFDQLAESDRLRRELISNVSHDLRTPLAAMQGYLETLIIKSETLDSAKQRKYLEVAHRHSKRLRDLVSQLFELSKLEAGRVQPQYEIFSLTELVYDVRQDYELRAQEKGLELIAKVPDENVLVNADISLMQRVLQNLIDNAISHSKESGEVTLSLKLEGRGVQVGVFDTGRGIAAEDIPYVFKRFYQSTSDVNPELRKDGAGLGLSIVQKILELHDSIISVRSQLNTGTEFSFALMRV